MPRCDVVKVVDGHSATLLLFKVAGLKGLLAIAEVDVCAIRGFSPQPLKSKRVKRPRLSGA